MKLLLASILIFSISVCFSQPGQAASGQTSHHLICDGGHYEYLVYAPESSSETAAKLRPAIMVLHGAGDHANAFIEAWKPFAKRENVIIIAPELPRKLEFETAAPGVFRCIIKEASSLASLDSQQIYLFGHSMGGYLAYDGAMFDSDIFAAVCVHAMGIDPEYAGIVKQAARKTPIKIYIGDQDPLVPLAGLRRTRDLLVHAGFPVEYQELPGHDHNYYALAEQINADAWKFFLHHRMAPSTPRSGS
jgi:poly(3-hydroxybutyrate) depolymerase